MEVVYGSPKGVHLKRTDFFFCDTWIFLEETASAYPNTKWTSFFGDGGPGSNIGARFFFVKPESQFREEEVFTEIHFQQPPPPPNKNADTVDGQNPAPPRVMIIPLFIGF